MIKEKVVRHRFIVLRVLTVVIGGILIAIAILADSVELIPSNPGVGPVQILLVFTGFAILALALLSRGNLLKWWSSISLSDIQRNITYFSCLFLVILILLYFASLIIRSQGIYSYIKSGKKGFSSTIFANDRELGFSPISNVEAAMVGEWGVNVPILYNKDGCRIPIHQNHTMTIMRPIILALGGSFTHGDYCLAEEAYPYLVAKALNGGTALNGGLCSYGLPQMLLRAEKLIPKYKPEYVIIQYSPWLVDRSMTYFDEPIWGKRTKPYLFARQDRSLAVHSPIFENVVFAYNLSRYRNDKTGFLDFAAFFFDIGGPLFFSNDINMSLYYCKRLAGRIPKPIEDRDTIVRNVYDKIQRLCKRYQSRMVVVVLGAPDLHPQPKELELLYSLEDATVINAWDEMCKNVTDMTADNYYKVYGIWAGSPPVLFDRHPNTLAHKVIARAIIRKIKQ